MSWSKAILVSLLFIPSSWTRVSRLNKAIEKAEKSYSEARYEDAAKDHQSLIDEFQLTSFDLDFDMGLSLHYYTKPDEALTFYDQVTQNPDKKLASFAYNQSGVILGDKKEY